MWLTQKEIAELFGVDRTVVAKHLKDIFMTGEHVDTPFAEEVDIWDELC